MRSPRILKNNTRKHHNGFTLVEMLVVLGLVALIFAVIPMFDIGSYMRQSAKDKARTFVLELQKARNEAMNGRDQVQFEGVVFERLSGNVNEEHVITFEDGVGVIEVTINKHGGIDW